MYDRPPAVRRLWIPIIAVCLTAATAVGVWYYPDPEFRADYRSMISASSVMLGILIVGMWVLFLSGMRWVVRLGLVFAAVALVGGAVSSVEFQGNMQPIFHFRWEHHDRGNHEATSQVAIPEPTPVDFPEYPKPQSRWRHLDLKLDRGWAIHPPQKLWRLSVGGGYAGISVVGQSAVTLEQIGENEAVVCYDAEMASSDGIIRIPHCSTKPWVAMDRAPIPRSPTATSTRLERPVTSPGSTARPERPNGAVEIMEGRNNIYWGMSGSPLVYDNFVVVNPGRNRKGMEKDSEPGTGPAVVAYDRDTGKVAWETGERQAGYSSPQLATIAGVRQVLVFDSGGLGSFDPLNGKELWFYPWVTDPEVNVAQPLVFDDGRVFISSGYGHGCAMLQVDSKGRNMGCRQAVGKQQTQMQIHEPPHPQR